MKRVLKWIGLVVLFFAALGVILRLIVFDYVIAGGEDTYPNIGKNAWMVVNRGAELRRGDLVLYQSPNAGYQIRRIIALPGEKVALTIDSRPIIDGVEATHKEVKTVTLDGRKYRVLEETLGGRTYQVFDDTARSFDKPYPEKVSEGGYFLVGDNREHSQDSRIAGVVPRDKIRGVVWWQLSGGTKPWK